jgi:hypothetical protein
MKEIKGALNVAIKAKVPAILWGPPGIGKSSIVKQIAESMGLGLIDMRLVQMSAVDLRGLPVADRETMTTRWFPPNELPRVERDGAHGILFLDELCNAPREVQSAALQLILDRRLGEYRLPEGWVIVSASNRPQDKAGSYAILSSLANRMIHIPVYSKMPAMLLDIKDVRVSQDEWTKWAYQAEVHPLVIGYLNKMPQMMYKTDNNQVAYPSPRSWEMVSRVLQNTRKVSSPETRLLISGCIGEGPAVEFIAFSKVADSIPDPEDILLGKNPVVPKEGDAQYACCSALVSRLASTYRRRDADTRAKNFIGWIQSLPTEFQILAVRDAFKVGSGLIGKITDTDEFTEWSRSHQAVFAEVAAD